MKPLYKCLTALFLTGLSLTVHAQDLVRKIPADALAVGSIKGKNLTSLMSLTEFNNSFIGKAILSKLAKKADKPLTTVEDLGFNLSATFYYYHQNNDSVTYNCFLAPVKNAEQLDAIYKQNDQKFDVKGNMRSHYNADSTEIARWNGEMFFFVKAGAKREYFMKPEVRERFGLTDVAPMGTDAYKVEVDSAVSIDTAYALPVPMTKEGTQQALEFAEPGHQVKATHSRSGVKNKAVYKKTTNGKKKALARKPGAIKKKVSVKKEIAKEVVQPITIPAEDYTQVDTATTDMSYAETTVVDSTVTGGWHTTVFFEDDRKRNAGVAKWTEQMVTDFMEKESKSSILDNSDFVKSLDDKAEATIWVSGVDKLFNIYMPSSVLKGLGFMKGYGSGNVKLYLEDKSIRIASSMTFSDEIAAMFKQMHHAKLNKRFLKYVDEDRMIGYLGYAVDTKAYLEGYPKLLSKIYGSIYSDEIEMAADLFSLVLDEEAIAKVIKGDALFIFNGLSQKEMSYKSYEYNEDNFESKEVMKTKKETLPDFLMMVSSEDTRLIDKLIAYGVKKQLVKQAAGYYELSIPKSPITLYFAIKDKIIFFGTSKMEMDNIASGRYVSKVSAKHKQALLSGNYAAYFSAKKLSGKIPVEAAGVESQKKANRVLNAIGDIYMKSNPIKGNTVSGQISMDIPANQPNALKYLFSIIEDAQK